jgi:hypothetical protein
VHRDTTPIRIAHTRSGVAAICALLTLAACGENEPVFEFDESAPIVCDSGQELVVPPPGALYHGVYPGGRSGEEDDLVLADVQSYEATVGRSVAWVYFSHNWYRDRTFPIETATWIRDHGAVPFVRLMLRSSPQLDVQEPTFTLEAIASGAFDDDLAAWGQAAADFGTPLVVEWGTEVNGSWFSWNGTWNGGESRGPALFRAAYRHIVRTVCAQGPNNVTWAFHINAGDFPRTPWNAFENYYPGDDAVDWLGLSAYGALTPEDDEWPIFADQMDMVVDRLVGVAPDKPVFVLEFGATSGNLLGDPAAWADAALSELLGGRWPAVRGFSWWNETWPNDDVPSHDTNMRVQDVPGLGAVFQSHLADPTLVDRPILPVSPSE